MRYQARLDDFYIIIKTENIQINQGLQGDYETTLIKFKQSLPEKQLDLWHKA